MPENRVWTAQEFHNLIQDYWVRLTGIGPILWLSTVLGANRLAGFARTRRETLKVGALSLLGGCLSTSQLLAWEQSGKVNPRRATAKSVVLLYLLGGAPTQDMYDMKPVAPADVRSQFKPVASTAPLASEHPRHGGHNPIRALANQFPHRVPIGNIGITSSIQGQAGWDVESRKSAQSVRFGAVHAYSTQQSPCENGHRQASDHDPRAANKRLGGHAAINNNLEMLTSQGLIAVAEVETIKVTVELPSPVAGTVVEVNPALATAAETINQDPYGAGWLMRIRPDDKAHFSALLDAKAYEAALAAETH